jgi:pantoate--beta-alanine ligase
MTIFDTVDFWISEEKKLFPRSVGFVPTMGALHEGHLSLVRRSREENDLTVVSIYLNPTQFDNTKDLEKYPRDLETDVRKLEKAGADYLFTPRYVTVYPDGYRYRVSESELSRILCGASRSGHFDGVLTVVLKLLLIIAPGRAYFGEKDYQQYLLIRGMVDAFFLKTRIVPCPIVREKSGLAMSSRNERLSPEGRKRAAEFYRILASRLPVDETKKELMHKGFRVDYVEERMGRLFAAVFLEEVRLIDNVPR